MHVTERMSGVRKLITQRRPPAAEKVDSLKPLRHRIELDAIPWVPILRRRTVWLALVLSGMAAVWCRMPVSTVTITLGGSASVLIVFAAAPIALDEPVGGLLLAGSGLGLAIPVLYGFWTVHARLVRQPVMLYGLLGAAIVISIGAAAYMYSRERRR